MSNHTYSQHILMERDDRATVQKVFDHYIDCLNRCHIPSRFTSIWAFNGGTSRNASRGSPTLKQRLTSNGA